jgi:hypothetical protein
MIIECAGICQAAPMYCRSYDLFAHNRMSRKATAAEVGWATRLRRVLLSFMKTGTCRLYGFAKGYNTMLVPTAMSTALPVTAATALYFERVAFNVENGTKISQAWTQFINPDVPSNNKVRHRRQTNLREASQAAWRGWALMHCCCVHVRPQVLYDWSYAGYHAGAEDPPAVESTASNTVLVTCPATVR